MAPRMTKNRPSLQDATLYFNRELAQLDFNARVLELAKDPSIPLLERLRFLTISSSNLDEFFEIRVAGLKQLLRHDLPRVEFDGMSVQETLKRISERAHLLVDDQYRVLNDVVLPELSNQGLDLPKRRDWTRRQQQWIREFFEQQVLPVLTPVGLDPAHPFPRIVNKSLNFIVSLSGDDAFERDSGIAIVQVPRSLPRVIALPKELSRQNQDFVTLSSVIHAHIEDVFPGMQVEGCYQFRVTRNSDLLVDEEEVDDLMRALKGELHGRLFGEAVRLEVADTCPPEIARFLFERFELTPDDLFFCNGPVNLNRLSQLHALIDRPDLKFAPFIPATPKSFEFARNWFDAIKKGDQFLHHPYDSFNPVVEVLRQAARDPDVLAIKMTLYRVGSDSPIVEALIEAARLGTEVTVLVELRARFDEAQNIDLATKLQEAGARVSYGIVGYKTHAKMLLIVRRDGPKLQRFVHLSTGNYHHRTAQAYTDVGFLTCDEEIGKDVSDLFNLLTGISKVMRPKRLLVSPFSLHKSLLALVRREQTLAQQGKPARIIAKMNSLTEAKVIQALYRASQAGVQIDLVIRGVCCLKPGVAGISENIRVRSVLGRFLEHSRVWYFEAGGKEEIYCSSADWMERNLLWRVEVAFPILDVKLKRRLFAETLDFSLQENVRAWILQSDGSYARLKAQGKPRSAQNLLLERAAQSSSNVQPKPKELEPLGFFEQIRPSEKVVVEPPLGEFEHEPGTRNGEADLRQRPETAAPIESNGDSQQRT
jgi:polyphosphate kinase